MIIGGCLASRGCGGCSCLGFAHAAGQGTGRSGVAGRGGSRCVRGCFRTLLSLKLKTIDLICYNSLATLVIDSEWGMGMGSA